MKSIILSFLFIIICIATYAQDFEGKIFLISNSLYDTLYYTYSVKGKYIKIDELNKQKKLTKALIINTENKSIIAINTVKKLYTRLPIDESQNEKDDQGFDVIKTINFKIINGYKCNLWRVRNKDLNTDISYWVAVDKFSFFDNLIKTLHTNEKYLSFFLKLPSIEGAMPMMSVERTLLRDEKNCITVLEVNKKKINDSLFIVPNDYKQFDVKY
jgi:hypothetical protein